MFKVNNKNTKQRHSHLYLVFLLLTLKKQMLAGLSCIFFFFYSEIHMILGSLERKEESAGSSFAH